MSQFEGEWVAMPTDHCGRCNNPFGVFNPACRGRHVVLVWQRWF